MCDEHAKAAEEICAALGIAIVVMDYSEAPHA
jgi:acetyl esterase/lipase